MEQGAKELRKARRAYLVYGLFSLSLGLGYFLVYLLLPPPPADGGLCAAGGIIEDVGRRWQDIAAHARMGSVFGALGATLPMAVYYFCLVLRPNKCLEKYRKNHDERRRGGREKAGYMAFMSFLVVLLIAIIISTAFSLILSLFLICMVYVLLAFYGIFYLYYKYKY